MAHDGDVSDVIPHKTVQAYIVEFDPAEMNHFIPPEISALASIFKSDELEKIALLVDEEGYVLNPDMTRRQNESLYLKAEVQKNQLFRSYDRRSTKTEYVLKVQREGKNPALYPILNSSQLCACDVEKKVMVYREADFHYDWDCAIIEDNHKTRVGIIKETADRYRTLINTIANPNYYDRIMDENVEESVKGTESMLVWHSEEEMRKEIAVLKKPSLEGILFS
jgi:hypothetical protein